MNKLSLEQVENQLFHLSKESIKQLVFNSKCGIVLDPKESNLKNIPNTDINTINLNSPLLCIYKKANPKLKNKNNKLCWDEEDFKKDINISSNGYMTLALLELADYYKKFKDIDKKKYALSNVYVELARKQLEFYASNLRNLEGVFVDKKDCTDPLIGKLKIKDKNKGFKFWEQALLMNAFYKCSTYLEGEVKDSYKNFSLDILNMFLEFKDEIYDVSFEDRCNLCLNLNIFYTYSKIEDVKPLILDIFDLLYEEYNSSSSDDKIQHLCLMYLNSAFLFKHTNMFKFKRISSKINDILKKHYDKDLCMFIKTTESKEIKFSCDEIVLYLISMIYQYHLEDDVDEKIITDVFKSQLVDSGIVLSWPDIPTLDNVEHYKDFNSKPENLLDDQYFKLPTIPAPEISQLAPIFIKYVVYNKEKHTFKASKCSFDSRRNLNLFFLILFTLSKTP
jgi:hypothetical protein